MNPIHAASPSDLPFKAPAVDILDIEEEPIDEPAEDIEPIQPLAGARPVRTRTVRGEDGVFPTVRKDAAVAEARAAESRAKDRRAEARNQRAVVEEVNEDEAEEGRAALADDAEFEYWCLAATDADDEPKTWKQAQNSPFSEEWRKAYQAELDSIKEHGVYELVPRESVPNGRKIIRSRPVFKIKRGSSGEILKFKARLVSMGYAQVAGQDYRETYAPTSRFESFRMVLHAGAARRNLARAAQGI